MNSKLCDDVRRGAPPAGVLSLQYRADQTYHHSIAVNVAQPRDRSGLQAREGVMQVGPAYIVAEAVRNALGIA